MAIDNLYFAIMTSALKMVKASMPNAVEKNRVGCLSYPDLLVTRDLIAETYPELDGASFAVRKDAEKIKRWHGMSHLNEVIETSDFFEKIGCDADYFDFEEIRGDEIVCDLNFPISEIFCSQYDLVIDTATLEHCFNVGTAFENMCKLARINGYIVTAAPMSKVNHGFWNFSPCVYDNYFEQNNFEINLLGAFHNVKGKLTEIEISRNGRHNVPSEAVLLSIARRRKESTFIWPLQKKYMS